MLRPLPARAVRRHAPAGRDRARARARPAADRLRRADDRARRDRAAGGDARRSRSCSARSGFTAILISHDLGVVLEATDRVLVMYAGRIVEDQPSARPAARAATIRTPRRCSTATPIRARTRCGSAGIPGAPPDLSRPHRAARSRRAARWPRRSAAQVDPPLTALRRVARRPRRLPAAATSAAASRRTVGRPMPARSPPLVVESVTKQYPRARTSRRGSRCTAVDDVSFTIEPGAAVGLVGASGSGKSTLAKLITGSERPTAGAITFGDLRGRPPARARAAATTTAGADGLPGSVRRRSTRCTPSSTRSPGRARTTSACRRGSAARPGPRAARDRRADAGRAVRGEAAAPALRRPAPARRDRPGARLRSAS